MFRKEEDRFPAEGGIEISAWLFVPERRATPLPAVTMAHGYAKAPMVMHQHHEPGLGKGFGHLFEAMIFGAAVVEQTSAGDAQIQGRES
jgi:hypothetical protein